MKRIKRVVRWKSSNRIIGIVSNCNNKDNTIRFKRNYSVESSQTEEIVEISNSADLMDKTSFKSQAFRWKWKNKVKNVLIVQKPATELIEKTRKISDLLRSRLGVTVHVTEATFKHLNHLQQYKTGNNDIDLVLSLGGDGTFLYSSGLFEKRCPPIMSFSLGTLGFLTPFDFNNAEEEILKIIQDGCFVNRRIRLFTKIIKKDGRVIKQTDKILNEVFVSRGASPSLTNIKCYCDNTLITTVKADGVIISTPTGSTAYSLSAGGPLVHPSIPSIVFTPICPHSLSFRPVVLPSESEIRIVNPSQDQQQNLKTSSVAVQFDGRTQIEVEPGDAVVITVSKWAVPAVSQTSHTNEWFKQLAVKLNWNAESKGGFKSSEYDL